MRLQSSLSRTCNAKASAEIPGLMNANDWKTDVEPQPRAPRGAAWNPTATHVWLAATLSIGLLACASGDEGPEGTGGSGGDGGDMTVAGTSGTGGGGGMGQGGGGSGGSGATAPGGQAGAGTGGSAGDQVVPTDGAALDSFLDQGRYKTWPVESAPHSSAGPHFGRVLTFINETLRDSLEAGNASHPVGSASVKELFGPSGNDVLGYAVFVKTQADSDAGQGWYWYEIYNDNVVVAASGAGLCTGCHSGGSDFVLTPFPLQ